MTLTLILLQIVDSIDLLKLEVAVLCKHYTGCKALNPLFLPDLFLFIESFSSNLAMFVNQRFELLQAQTEDLDICQCFHIYIHDLIYEKRSEIDTSSRSEFINYKVVVLKLGRNFDFSLLDEEDGSDLVLLLHDHMILLKVLGSQAEDKIKHHEVRCFTEVVDATNHIRKSLESVVLV